MRYFALVPLLGFALAAHAQNCVNMQLPLDNTLLNFWRAAGRSTDGNIVGTTYLEYNEYYDTRRIFAVKFDPSGDIIWQRMIKPLNANVALYPFYAVPSNDGGIFVSGYTSIGPPPNYWNYFVVKLTTDGEVDWGRYYMMDNTVSFGSSLDQRIALAPDGHLVYAMWRNNGIVVVHLDTDGLPVSTWRYEPEPATTDMEQGIGLYPMPDGSVTVYGETTNNSSWFFNASTNGTVNWTHQYAGLLNVGLYPLPSGGSILAAYPKLFKFDDQGDIIWGKHPTTGSSIAIEELSGGDLLGCSAYGLFRMQPDGTPIGSYPFPSSIFQRGMFDVVNDSVFMTTMTTGDFRLGHAIIPVAAGLGCLGSSTTYTTSGQAIPTSLSDTCYAHTDSIKTWTMAFAPPIDFEELDLVAGIASDGARPGFVTTYYANSLNFSGLTSGPITATMTYDPSLVLQSASPTPTSTSPGMITWALPADSGGFIDQWTSVQAHLFVPTNTPLGDTLVASFSIAQDSVETTLDNNIAYRHTIVVNSYDPNNKEVWPRDVYHLATDSILDYTVNFQNTGTAEAINVVVVDTLPLDVDVNTFAMGPSSHPSTWSLTGNGILTVTFSNINLPDSASNEPDSHGLFNFRIKPIEPLVVGQMISNAVDIYFDFNSPIHTNDAIVVVGDIGAGIPAVVQQPRLAVFPVPAKELLNVVVPEGFTPVNAWVAGSDGRIPMRLSSSGQGTLQLSVRSLPPDAYILTLYDRNGRAISARFIKE